MKRAFAFLVSFAFCISLYGQTNVFWRADGPDSGDWHQAPDDVDPCGAHGTWDALKWFYSDWGDHTHRGRPDCHDEGLGHRIHFDNAYQTNMDLNVSWYSVHQILFQNEAPRTINGINGIDMHGIGAKIENESSGTHTFNAPIAFQTTVELNPVSGSLVFNSQISNNGHWTDVWGGPGNSLTISGGLSGAGGLAVKNNTLVVIANEALYSGGTTVEAGTLELQGSLASSGITVQSGATLRISNGNNKSNVIEINDLTVEPGGIVEIEADVNLTVKGTLTNNGSLTIKSNATGTGSLIHNSEGVDAIVEYYMEESAGDWPNDKSTDWYWISAPVTGQAIADFLDGYEDQYDLYRWDESVGSWLNYKADDFIHTSFELGTGYLTAFEDERIHKFDGELIVANITWSDLTLTSGTYEGSELSAGWHLIGNPYASGIVFSTAAGEGQWTQTNVELTPQVWNAGTETYDAVLADEVIESVTAFFVRATNETNTLTIPAAARQHAVNDDKNQPSANYIILASKPVDSQLIQRSYLRIEPDTDQFFDNRYDSRFRPGNAPIFHSFREEHKLLVNAVSAIHDDLSIPFVFEKIESADEYSINIERSIEGVSLYIVDRKLDKEHLLTSDNPYLFISDVGDAPYRFDLRFAPMDDDDITNLPDTDKPALQIWQHNNTLHVDNPDTDLNLNLYDINGRRLQNHHLAAGQHHIELNLTPGVYIIETTGNKHHETMKIIIQ